MGWKTRAALVASSAWLILVAAIADDAHRVAAVLGFAVLPVAVLWGLSWTIAGWLAERRAKAAAPSDRPSRRSQAVEAAGGETAASRRLRIVSHGLFVGAVAAPFTGVALGLMPAYDAGRWLGQAVFIVALVAAVVGLALRRRSPEVQSYGRAAVGAGTLVWAMTVTASAWLAIDDAKQTEGQLVKEYMQASLDARKSTEAASAALPDKLVPGAMGDPKARQVAFVRAATQHAVQLQRKFMELDQKFQGIDFSQALAPETLTQETGIAASREKLGRFGLLVDERGAILKRYATEIESFLRTADIDEGNRKSAIESYTAGNLKSQQAFYALDSAQRASMKAVSNVLDFAQANLGRMKAKDGQMMFRTQRDLDRYNVLMAQVNEKAAAEEAAVARVQALQQEQSQALADRVAR